MNSDTVTGIPHHADSRPLELKLDSMSASLRLEMPVIDAPDTTQAFQRANVDGRLIAGPAVDAGGQRASLKRSNDHAA